MRDADLQVNDLTEEPLTQRLAKEDRSPAVPSHTDIGVRYVAADAKPAAEGVLAAVCFGAGGQDQRAPLSIETGLHPLLGGGCNEIWLATEPVQTGRDGSVRYACDRHFMFAAVELDERDCNGISNAAEAAYAEVRRFQRHCSHPHLLRMWNCLDAINEGVGDVERYRQFCVGRGRGWGETPPERYPAASAIGRQLPTHRLQV
jgi:chorismate lyase/3-hydroxybenzoate synthase